MSRSDNVSDSQLIGSVDYISTLIERYRLRAHRASRAHYLAGKAAGRLHRRLGVPVVVLTTVVGSAAFASIGHSGGELVALLAGLASILASVLAALQTFLGAGDRSEKHRLAGSRYSALKRDFDFLALLVARSTPIDEALVRLQQLIDALGAQDEVSPDVPDHFYDRARREQDVDSEGV